MRACAHTEQPTENGYSGYNGYIPCIVPGQEGLSVYPAPLYLLGTSGYSRVQAGCNPHHTWTGMEAKPGRASGPTREARPLAGHD